MHLEFLLCCCVIPLRCMYCAIHRHEPQVGWSSALNAWDHVVGELPESVKECNEAYWERPLVKMFSRQRYHDEKAPKFSHMIIYTLLFYLSQCIVDLKVTETPGNWIIKFGMVPFIAFPPCIGFCTKKLSVLHCTAYSQSKTTIYVSKKPPCCTVHRLTDLCLWIPSHLTRLRISVHLLFKTRPAVITLVVCELFCTQSSCQLCAFGFQIDSLYNWSY